VFITDLNKSTHLVGVGDDPFFSPDGKELFALQNDGLHAVEVSTITASANKQNPTFGTMLVPPPTGTKTPALRSMKISVSPDGTHLAWSVPTSGFVRIYRVQSWAPLSLLFEKDIPLTALYSTFSPDSKYLALEQVALDAATKKFINPHIVIYRLSDYASVDALDLSAYSTSYSGISAWR
jgi:WD40 repeat protein